MKTAILDAATLGADLPLDGFSAFGAVECYDATAPQEVAERLATADIAVVNKVRLSRETLGEAPHIRLICIAATGYDNIDLPFCRERGIAVTNVPGYSTDSVAQLTAAMVFSLATHLPEYADFVAGGGYSASGVANRLVPVYHDLAGRIWGVVGYGGIGRRVADIARAIGCRVLVCRAHPTGAPDETDIDTLCAQSDIISLHTPLNDGTRGLISRERLAHMKPGAILINTARGAVTDEHAVVDAVLTGRLGAFGCDVYTAEPFPATHPYARLLGRPNVCLTPHMAWGSYESRRRCVEIMLENIRAFSAGGRQNRLD